MSSREFSEWQAYWRVEPFGESTLQWQLATLCALTVNAHSDRKAKQLTADDFMPRIEEEPQEADPSKLFQRIKMWATLAGAKRGDPK